MKGFHVYYKYNDDDSEYDYIDFLGHLCSILFWKLNYNEIHLICNKSFYKSVKDWGLDKYYDSIDIEIFDNIPKVDKLNIYWSFPKIYAINHISQNEESFCVLDTDIWFYDQVEFNQNHALVGYHLESLTSDISSPYIDINTFSTSQEYNWNISPINCAFLYFNSKDLISKWYKEVLFVIENTTNLDVVNSSHTVFIEQRLLTTVCKNLNLKFSTLLENTYIPFAPKDGSEWIPPIGYTKENLNRSQNIKHIWGLKKMYNDIQIRNMVLGVCKVSLDYYFPDWELYNIKLSEELYKNIDLEELKNIEF